MFPPAMLQDIDEDERPLPRGGRRRGQGSGRAWSRTSCVIAGCSEANARASARQGARPLVRQAPLRPWQTNVNNRGTIDNSVHLRMDFTARV
jgi:hypothetical protein